jgi:hypothetical protein
MVTEHRNTKASLTSFQDFSEVLEVTVSVSKRNISFFDLWSKNNTGI